MDPRNLYLWASDSICFILPFEKKPKTTKHSHPVPQKHLKWAGGRKTSLSLVGVKSCDVIQRRSNEDNVTSSPDASFFCILSCLRCLRCKMHANRPVLFTKLFCVWRKPWFCGPARLEGTAAALRVQSGRTCGLWPSSGKCRSSHQFHRAEVQN